MVRSRPNDEPEKDSVNQDSAGDGSRSDTSRRSVIDRRSYLRLAGAAAGSAALTTAASGSAASQSIEEKNISFDRTVNVVDDLGVDPTGGQAVNGALSSAARSGTLFEFPEGTYRFSGQLSLSGYSRIGFRGNGDVTFVPPNGFNDWIVNVSVGQFLFQGIDIDITASNTNAGIRPMTNNGFVIEDVEFLGRGIHSSNDQITNMINCAVGNSSETGIIKNVTARKGSAWAHYHPSGRVGIWAGGSHNGTVKVIDCHLEEFGNNGMYCSRCPGKVQVYGGFFRNNNVSSIRISGEGSFVDGATISVDPDAYTGPRTQEGTAWQMRGVVVESAAAGQGKPRGAVVQNSDFLFKPNPTNGEAIRVWGNGRTLTVRNCHIQMDHDRPAIRRDRKRQQGRWDPSDDPRWVRVENTTITGTSSGNCGIAIREASGSRVENCCIDQSGSNQDGVEITNSDNCVVGDCNINVSGNEIDLSGSNADTYNIANDSGCSDGEFQTPEDRLPNTLVIDGEGSSEWSDYAFSVGEEVEQSVVLSKYGTGGEISDDGTSVEGSVRGGADGFRFAGDLTSFQLVGDAAVYLNGERVGTDDISDGVDLGGSDDSTDDSTTDDSTTDDSTTDDSTTDGDAQDELSRTLVFDGEGSSEWSDYAFTVGEAVEQSEELSEYGVGGEISDDGTSVEGSVRGGVDGFRFAGEITAFDLNGDATVYLDGEAVDPAGLGGSDTSEDTSDGTDDSTTDEGTTDDGSADTDELPSVIVIDGEGSTEKSEYTFSVSGEIERSEELSEYGTGGEIADDGTVTGFVRGGADGFRFSGELTSFQLRGSATVSFEDGQ